MTRVQGINLPVLKDKDAEVQIRKAFIDALRLINVAATPPPGFVYLQWTGTASPEDLWGGSWTDITATYTGIQGTLWEAN